MSPLDLLFEGASKLAEKIADEISSKTGIDKAITFPIALEAARAWVDEERRAVTDAREAAKARVKASGR